MSVIEFEGNLGVGKSTLLRQLETLSDDHVVFYEQVNPDFLHAFYKHPKKFSFAFQMYMLVSRIYQMNEAARQSSDHKKTCFLDRGAVGDTVFAHVAYIQGTISSDDFKIYKSVCKDRLPKSLSENVDLIVYLDSSPEECHRRVTKLRQNSQEKDVPLKYFEKMDLAYFDTMMQWMGGQQSHELNVGSCPPVLVVCWEQFDTAERVWNLIQNGHRAKVEFTTSHPQNCIHNLKEIRNMYDSEPGASQVFVKWNIRHTNIYRRFVMRLLSKGTKVTFVV